ncbi:MAG: hypothetical protein HY261_06775 [Chloroflexi bacterium]|nr:hypothetical protein [Chloroflexota bacterium]
MEVLLPIPERPRQGLAPSSRLSSLRGKTIGFLDNGWWCFDIVYKVFDDALRHEHGVKQLVRVSKYPTVATPLVDIERLVAECGAVITGLGN